MHIFLVSCSRRQIVSFVMLHFFGGLARACCLIMFPSLCSLSSIPISHKHDCLITDCIHSPKPPVLLYVYSCFVAILTLAGLVTLVRNYRCWPTILLRIKSSPFPPRCQVPRLVACGPTHAFGFISSLSNLEELSVSFLT